MLRSCDASFSFVARELRSDAKPFLHAFSLSDFFQAADGSSTGDNSL